MKTTREWKQVTITKKGTKKLQSGHPWVYEGEVLALEANIQNGDIVDVFSEKGSYQGSGLYNGNSRIRIRLLSRNANDRFDEDFFYRRLQHAISYRATVMGEDFDACRLIFGEADYLPGLTVDRFHDLLVVQTLSYGMEQRKDMLFPMLVKILRDEYHVAIRGIYERNDVAISYDVDVENGQKTGFFLDQKYNRAAIARIAKGKHVLDCFTHTGSFALNAAKGGAAHVHAVDISQTVIDMAQHHADINGLQERMSFETADVFDLLKALKKQPRVYDMIILDPPAFTKSRETISHAVKGYREINTAAMKLLPRGGYLATCSCSHFMNEGLFKSMLHEAAQAAGVSLRQIEARQQSCDHPILWNVPETSYLKFYIFQIA